MVSSLKEAYGAAATAPTVAFTLTSLANAAARQSILVDNTTNLYDDYLVKLVTKAGSASTATVDLYVSDANQSTSPNFADGASGADAAFTTGSSYNNLTFLGSVTLNGTTAVTSRSFSIATAMGGNVPPKFSIIGVNNGTTLSATAGDHILTAQGVYYTSG